ncbi:MAG: bifunctional diaminohydroxyphosphoribosylaminopyrimidine deaminase/5-amino-6-(5-phosphoribosylamino)uracil reductase RibD [Deltaproteobacteria bacterium]|nr:bifunctional diaminohydroxyphosphoribosylaminopyrimidine deaminase/5-amino-6-(5-phosphoribosylamino)uracil reductase RibD [Deltaproteobacteria bacterium]
MAKKGNNSDKYFILKTLELAKKAEGLTSPNPMVGALVVKDGVIVGEGWHEKAGQPHAEVAALRNAGEKAKDATIYVSLEPCSHFGKTPPCVCKIKESGIKRVVAAVKDPNPLVSGRGFNYLRDSGIEVTYGILEEKAKRLNEVFFKNIISGLPFITIKEAVTLDGNIGYKNCKEKTYLSSGKSLEYTHYLRFINDAIMVSAKTVVQDDPMLDVRKSRGGIKNKFLTKRWTKIILDSGLIIPIDSKVFSSYGDVLIFTSSDYDREKDKKKKLLKEKGAIIIDVYYNNIKDKMFLNLQEIFRRCGKLKITSILVEAGPELFSSLILEKSYDKLIFNLTPDILGSKNGIDLFKPLGLEVKEKIKFGGLNVKKFGDEIFLSYYPKN